MRNRCGETPTALDSLLKADYRESLKAFSYIPDAQSSFPFSEAGTGYEEHHKKRQMPVPRAPGNDQAKQAGGYDHGVDRAV
jgi:hypothetical protein